MKGILLCGGTGSRMGAMCKVTNKHLNPIAGIPMAEHGVRKFRQAGIKDVIIVTGTEHAGAILSYFGSGKDFGVNVTYKIQDTANGIAGALALCEGILQPGDRFVVILGDNIFADSLLDHIDKNRPAGTAKILLRCVTDPQRFGVAELLPDGMVKNIEEKPKEPKSNLAVTGIYQFDSKVFDFIRRIDVSQRGEFEIADVLNLYISHGALYSGHLNSYWSDAGTKESYARVNNLFYEGKLKLED
jgi:glucose-1-phosphate thymidylyltransferase